MPICCCMSWTFRMKTGRFMHRLWIRLWHSSGAQDIPRVMVYNKADKCDPDVIPFIRPDEGVKISAKSGEGIDDLLTAIEKGTRQGQA